MPTKTQAKAAIDNAATQTKADIDNILPAGVNIRDGNIAFNPIHWTILMSVADVASAETLAGQIIANLTTAGRGNVLMRLRRGDDGIHEFTITTALATYKIDF